jgi:DNA-binding LacI/PurR family transcriptional regulator
VPEDVLVVGFDDSPLRTVMHPDSRSTQPAYDIGRIAGDLLAGADARDEPRHVVCTPTLVVRESSIRPVA